MSMPQASVQTAVGKQASTIAWICCQSQDVSFVPDRAAFNGCTGHLTGGRHAFRRLVDPSSPIFCRPQLPLSRCNKWPASEQPRQHDRLVSLSAALRKPTIVEATFRRYRLYCDAPAGAGAVTMIRQFVLPTCGLAAALICASLSFAQYNSYGQATTPVPVQTNPFNPFNTLPGYAGQQLSQMYNQSIATRTPSLSQLALRNAQAITQNSMQQQGP